MESTQPACRMAIRGWVTTATIACCAVSLAVPLHAQAWEVTELPPDPITDVSQAKAVLASSHGRQARLTVACDDARNLLILLHVNGTLTPESRSDGMYWGTLRARFDKRPAVTVKTVISDGLDATGFDPPTTERLLPILSNSHELWIQATVEHMDERIQFVLPDDTKTAIMPVLHMCAKASQQDRTSP